jgi:cytosine/adenosine deaminase-related metal-dependent hydrolase
MGALAARFVALDATTVVPGGEIRWDAAGRIVSLRRAPVGTRLADVCILPALVNAHTHLQLPELPAPVRSFVPWIESVLAVRHSLTASAERALLDSAVREQLHSGVTAVGDIDATGTSADVLAGSKLRGRCYRELTGFHLDRAGARRLLRERDHERVRGRPGTLQGGWSPHAPYSVSADLFRVAAGNHRHLAIHCAEVPDEQRLLRSGDGPFADLLRGLGRLPADYRAPGVGAVRWLERLGVLRPGTSLVHCQELERGDVARIAAAGASIVVCPGTIEYFGRTPPPIATWLAQGIPVALGTDSRASNTALSLPDELARAARMWPALAPATLLAMATRHGARAVGGRGLGVLRVGGRADFLRVPAAATFRASLAAFVTGAATLAAVHVAGRPVPARPKAGSRR